MAHPAQPDRRCRVPPPLSHRQRLPPPWQQLLPTTEWTANARALQLPSSRGSCPEREEAQTRRVSCEEVKIEQRVSFILPLSADSSAAGVNLRRERIFYGRPPRTARGKIHYGLPLDRELSFPLRS